MIDDNSASFILGVLNDLLADFMLGEEDRVAPDENLVDVGFDSISLLDLVDRVNARFGVAIPADAILQSATLNTLVDAVLEQRGGEIAAEIAGK